MLFVVFAALAAITVVYTINNVAGMVPVAVAKGDIYSDTAVSPDNVGQSKVPRGAIQVDTVRDPIQLQGMSAKGYIPSGTVLRKSMFQSINSAGAVARLSLKPGYVALALQPDLDATCGGEVKPGCLVNVKCVRKDGSVQKIADSVDVLSAPEKSKGVVIALTETDADRLLAERPNSTVVLELLPPKKGG